MSEMDEQFLRRLLVTFKEEAREHITAIAIKLAELESAEHDALPPLLEVMFRDAHSLKAAARAVNQSEIEIICQSVEGAFAALKRGEAAPTPMLRDALQRAADDLSDFLAAIDEAPERRNPAKAAETAKMLDAALDGAMPSLGAPAASEAARGASAPSKSERGAGPDTRAQPGTRPAIAQKGEAEDLPREPRRGEPRRGEIAAAQAGATADTVRLSVHRLDALMLQAEEMLAEKLAARRLAAEFKEMSGFFSAWKMEWGKARAALPSLLTLPDEQSAADSQRQAARPLVTFLDWNESHMTAIETRLAGIEKMAAAETRSLGTKVDRLLLDMKQLLTLPSGTLLQLFPRVVRELARDQGKEVEFAIHGTDLELDRHVLDELKEPLLHMVRNCIDHGIEKPAERAAAGKLPRARITLSVAAVNGDKVEFIVEDDGAGISTRKLAAAAGKLGLLPGDRTPAQESELLPLIFQSGVSTSAMITELSGRGLGLAIVREKVERLGGTVAVESREGQGTKFRLVVPLTLATYRGIQIGVAERLFVLPTLNVERVVRADRTAVSTLENRAVLNFDGALIPLIGLRDVLDLPPGAAPASALRSDRLVAVVLGSAARRVAFEVDRVDGDQEILVKPLGKCLVRVRNIQGATVLATGAIAPILNVQDLLKSAAKATRKAQSQTDVSGFSAADKAGILVVEDSITARGLLKNILETAGYRVAVAVDGLDAWAMLKLEPFDLVVSDVEMPRMNGFELTARIRADRALTGLPVVLVTALESREDRERGVDAGANAYILKGGFEPGRLLEAVRRLV